MTASDVPTHRVLTGASDAGKTQHLIARLLALREHAPDSWARTMVWTRSSMAARRFAERLDAEVTASGTAADGYRPPTITTAHAWVVDAHRRGRFGLPARQIWPQWIEREAIRAACIVHAPQWPDGGDRRSADVPAYHKEILRWAGTLALNGLDPTAPLPDAVTNSRNGQRARNLAAVLADVAAHKQRANALGEHDLFPSFLAACADSAVLDAWRSEVAVLLIDDAQDLPLGAARLAAHWARGGGELVVCMDPDSPTSRFRGALPDAIWETFASELDVHREDVAAERTPTVGRHAAAVLRGTPPADGGAPDSDRITCVRVADEIEEAYELARRVRHAVYDSRENDHPLRYGDCAVIAQSLQPTGAYLADAFAFYGVPFVRRVGTALVNAPLARYALAYLTALAVGTPDAPPAELLAHGFAGPGLPAAAMHRLLHRWTGGEARAQPLLEVVGTPALPLPDEIDLDALRAWHARWQTLRAAWRDRGALAPVLRTLAQQQLLPALAHHATTTAIGERHHHAFQHLAHLLRLADTLDRDRPSPDSPIAMLERAARAEVAAEEWEANALGVQAVHILTPYAARDFPFRWIALAGFTADRWPPRFYSHVLHLDRATAAWLGREPLTLWEPDAATHEREWRARAAAVFERCDGKILLTVPRDGADGNPLDPTAWLAELDPLVIEAAPFADPQRGLTLAHALTPPEAAAALAAIEAEDDAITNARAVLGLPPPSAKPLAPAPVPLGDRALSASLLNTYLDCPRKCFYTRLLRVEDPPADLESAGLFGRIVHTVLERLHRSGRWPSWSATDEEPLRRAAHDLLAEFWRDPEIPAVFPNPIQRTYAYGRALAMLAGYARWLCAEHAGTEVVQVERAFEFTLAAARIRGRIDRVDRLADGRLRVIDYKTGSTGVVKGGRALARRFVNVDGKEGWTPKDLQMSVYALAHAHDPSLPGPAAETAICYLKVPDGEAPAFPIVAWGGAPAPGGKERVVLTDTQLDQARALVEQTVAHIRRGSFPPRPSTVGLCRRCPAWSVCTGPRFDEEDADS